MTPQSGATLAAMFETYREDRSAANRNAIVEKCLPFARQRASRMADRFGGVVDFDTLLSAACVGLIQAVEKFDPDRGMKFSTFADHRIDGEILDDVRRIDHASRKCRASARAVERARDAFYRREGRQPTDDELRAGLGVNAKQWGEMKASAHAARPHGRMGESAIRTRTRRRNPSTGVAVSPMLTAPRESGDWWDSALRGLGRREKALALMYYRDGLDQKVCGRTLGISASRCSQLLDVIRAKLRESSYLRRLLEEEVRDAA